MVEGGVYGGGDEQSGGHHQRRQLLPLIYGRDHHNADHTSDPTVHDRRAKTSHQPHPKVQLVVGKVINIFNQSKAST